MASSHLVSTAILDDLQPSSRWRYEYGEGEGEMYQMTCLETTKRGTRCRRKSVLSVGVCWQHLKSVAHLRIGRTRTRDENGNRKTFLGLFACDQSKPHDDIVFNKGDPICPYIGEIIDEDEFYERYPDDDMPPYAVEHDQSGMYIDASVVRGVGALANDCDEDEDSDCEVNAELVEESDDEDLETFPYLIATENIFNGEEILVNFGDAWRNGEHVEHETKPRSAYRRTEYKCSHPDD
jgi:hypothetical protein